MMSSPAPTAGIMRPALMKLRTSKVKPKANKPRGVALTPTGAAAACSDSAAACAIVVSTFRKINRTCTCPITYTCPVTYIHTRQFQCLADMHRLVAGTNACGVGGYVIHKTTWMTSGSPWEGDRRLYNSNGRRKYQCEMMCCYPSFLHTWYCSASYYAALLCVCWSEYNTSRTKLIEFSLLRCVSFFAQRWEVVEYRKKDETIPERGQTGRLVEKNLS